MVEQNTKTPWKAYVIMLIALFFLITCLAMHSPAYPSITKEFGVGTGYTAWMTAFYALSACVLAPVMGRLGDMFGMKKVLIFGCLAFVLGTFLCFFSRAFYYLLIGRFVQGIGIACSMPATMAFVTTNFVPQDIPKGFALFTVSSSLGSMAGPTISGVLIDNFGWRSVYLFGTVVILILAVVLVFAIPKVQKVAAPNVGRFDIGGTIALVVAVGSILLVPTIGAQNGWTHPLTLLLLALFLIFGFLFIKTERKVANPLISLKMLGNRNFLIPVLMLFFVGGTTQPYMYLNSYFMTAGLGFPATYTGIMTSILFLTSVIFASFFIAKLIERVAWRKLAFTIGFLMLLGIGLLCFAGPNSTFPVLAVSAVILGLSCPLGGTLTMTAALKAVPVDQQGVGSGTYRMLGDLGGPLLVAIYVPLMSIIGASPEGLPNYVAAYPKVNLLYLAVVVCVLILACLFPNNVDAKKNVKPQ